MPIRTKVFDLVDGEYKSIAEMARAMGVDPAYLYRIKRGERGIGPAFVAGAIKAFPSKRLEELFYLNDRGEFVS